MSQDDVQAGPEGHLAEPTTPARPSLALVRAPVPPSLTGLLVEASRGDEAAFALLYDATSSRAFGMASRVLGDAAQAEEVVQDAFLHVWLHSARFDPDRGSALAWILMITHGRAVGRVRSAEARARREVAYGREAEPRRPARDATFEQVRASDDAARVHAALAGLPATQREAVQLAYFGASTHTEVASLLGIPVGTAKSRIRGGLLRLRASLGEM